MIKFNKTKHEMKVDEPEHNIIYAEAKSLGLNDIQAMLYYMLVCIYTYCNSKGIYDLEYYSIAKGCIAITKGMSNRHYLAVTKIKGATLLKQNFSCDSPYYMRIYSTLHTMPEVNVKTPKCNTYNFSVNEPRLLKVLDKAYEMSHTDNVPEQHNLIDDKYTPADIAPKPVVPDTPTIVSEPLTNDKVLIPDCILNLYKYYMGIDDRRLDTIYHVICTIRNARKGACNDVAKDLMDISYGK